MYTKQIRAPHMNRFWAENVKKKGMRKFWDQNSDISLVKRLQLRGGGAGAGEVDYKEYSHFLKQKCSASCSCKFLFGKDEKCYYH